jgi:carboxymethylenebutenolidase
LDWKGAINDIAAAKKFLEGKRCKKIGILGFCMGGALTIAAAAMIPGFDAAAPFYGIPDLNTYHLENIKCKFQGHFG